MNFFATWRATACLHVGAMRSAYELTDEELAALAALSEDAGDDDGDGEPARGTIDPATVARVRGIDLALARLLDVEDLPSAGASIDDLVAARERS
jgi:hypothetical protein